MIEGDVAELVECAALEMRYAGNGIRGSNPLVSAGDKTKTKIFVLVFVLASWKEAEGLNKRRASLERGRKTERKGERR